MWSARASSTTTSPPARPTAARKVAATTRSATTVWSRVRARRLPRPRSREVPAPWMRAPIVGQERGEVRDLGLACGVLDHRRALGEHRGHQDVVGRGVARVLEDDTVATSRPRPGRDHGALDVAVARSRTRRPWPQSAFRWKSIGRSPKSSPPGIETRRGRCGRAAGRARRSKRASSPRARRAPRARGSRGASMTRSPGPSGGLGRVDVARRSPRAPRP